MTVCVQAQLPTGSITGLLTGPKSAVVSGASVTITSAAQGFIRHTARNTYGIYVLPDLPAGRYDLKIEQPGFAPSDFAQTIFADLNGDGVVNDLDIPLAVALKSSAPITPVPIPHVFDNYFGFYGQDDRRVSPRLTLNLGLRWEYDCNLTGNSSEHDRAPVSLQNRPNHARGWRTSLT